MFASLAVVSLFTTAAFAQSSTATANPLIPTGVSDACQSYLTSFNQDTSLSSCTSAIITATKAFAPGTGNATSDVVKSALSDVCSSSTSSACDVSTIRTQLTKFYAACADEITNGNKDVLNIYDVLFAISPLKAALCAQDDSGAYCLTKMSSLVNSTTTSSDLAKRDVALQPNTTTIGSSNLLFMFLKPDLPQSTLCTTCTRKILSSYINWEEDIQYGPGITNSPTMYNQKPLYDGVTNTCGASFMSGSVQAAGSLSDGSSDSSNAAIHTIVDFKAIMAVALGVTTLLAFH